MLVFYLQIPDSNRHTAIEDSINSVHKQRRGKLPCIESDEESDSLSIQRSSASLGVESPEEEEAAGGSKRKTMQQPINNFSAESEVPVKRRHIKNFSAESEVPVKRRHINNFSAEADVPVKRGHINNFRAEADVPVKRGHFQHQASSMYISANNCISAVMISVLWMMLIRIMIVLMRVNNALFIVRMLYTF